MQLVITVLYYVLGLILQTCSTNFQPCANQLNNRAPSKWLTPTPRKSYQMFFQKVTHSLLTYYMIAIGTPVFLPSPVTMGEGSGLGVFSSPHAP